ncbi:TPA: hypothetical protein U1B25_001104 [Streptococcus suis]|nr:hypothetical protein [Streptococcus suis]
MFNKTNNQTHYGIGDQNINQNVTNNIFITPGDTADTTSNEETASAAVIGIVVIAACGILWTTAKNNQTIVYAAQIVICSISTAYVFFKSRDLKTTMYNIVPSILAIGTTFASFKLTKPAFLENTLLSFPSKIKSANLESFISEFIPELLSSLLNTFGKLDGPQMVLSMLYIIFSISAIASPFSIAYTTFIKKDLKNHLTYVVNIVFWILYLIMFILY